MNSRVTDIRATSARERIWRKSYLAYGTNVGLGLRDTMFVCIYLNVRGLINRGIYGEFKNETH